MALPGSSSLSLVVEIHATLEGVAIAFFVALVVFDVLAHLNKKRETVFERIALVCFAVAVLAEVCAYPYSRRIDTLSSEANAVLNKEAGDARKEAGTAMEHSAQLQKDAEGLKKQVEDERLARARLQERLVWQGPREILIWGARDLFAKRLKPFGKQVATTSICGPQAFVGGLPGEINFAENALSRVLIRAGWKVDPFPFPVILTNCASETVFLGVRPDAPQETRDAAIELQSILNEVLLQNIGLPSHTPPPIGTGHWDGEPTVADVISIRVGRHPLYPRLPTKK